MPGFRLATFDTDGLAVAAGPPGNTERLILQALAVGDTAADLVALQGVPDMAALDAFRTALRSAVGRDYRHALLIDGNDPAGGHPAVISHLPIVHARSHRTLGFAEIGRLPPIGMAPGDAVFSRDCLEVEIEQQARRLSLFVCHFTASPPDATLRHGPDPARDRRQAEAAAVRRVIEQRFTEPARAEWIVLGNLADQPEDERGVNDPNHGLGPLLEGGFASDLAGPTDQRWSHFDSAANRYRRPDQILLSPALARRNQRSVVHVIRAGLPYRAARHTGQRYPRIGWLAPAASWHCPVVADITFRGAPHDAPDD